MPPDHASKLVSRIEAALQHMPNQQRNIFLAHRICGLSYREIARLTGLSEPAVEKLMARALESIDKELHGRRER